MNDQVLFRVCEYDDCTEKAHHWSGHERLCFECEHIGDIHFHCIKHQQIELATKIKQLPHETYVDLVCSQCKLETDNYVPILRRLSKTDIETLKQQAKFLINSEKFKGAKLIRLDDYYIPEISQKSLMSKESDYWVSFDLKKNKNGKPILVLYTGIKNTETKAQFFIEPETQKLSHDHKHGSPLAIISRVEVEFKDGKITLEEKADDTSI